MLACNCLNVIIEPETSDYLKVTLDSLGLTESESKDVFFRQEIRQVQKLKKITKNISGLVTSRNVGSWTIHHCINCNVHTHATHRDRGAAFVLVTSNLLTSSTISTLKNSGQYSGIFNIIVSDSCPVEDEPHYDYLSADVELLVNNLRLRVNEVVNRETAATEERIRQFTEQQHQVLDEFRDRALKEQRILRRRILDHKLRYPKDTETSTNIEMASPVSKSPMKNVPEDHITATPIITNKTRKIITNTATNGRQVNNTRLSNNSFHQRNSIDSEGLFQIEDMDDFNKYTESEAEDTDNEDSTKDEGGDHNQRQRNHTGNLAKSLPMNIPVFMSAYQNHFNEDSDDQLINAEDKMDIAASIKALAKSVHGDAVFGDLPRPRFSSQI